MTNRSSNKRIFILLTSALLLSCNTNVAAQDASGSTDQLAAEQGEFQTADLFVLVTFLQAEIELLRLEMGEAENRPYDLYLSGAQPHEVFFQTLTLFRKADQLCFEQTRQRGIAPQPPLGEVQQDQVVTVINLALERVQLVKSQLKITEKSEPAPRDPRRTLTDVFRSIVQANRQLNLLLQRPFQPSDVFQQVTFAVSYCSVLLEQFPQSTRLPQAPDFERRKRPADVYQRLVGCHRLLRQISEESGLELVQLEVSDDQLGQVTPSDVYDVASLLVSELAYLHARLPNAPAPRSAFNPGNKLPSHVYQRAGMLERQLAELYKLVEASPQWLRTAEDKP